MIDISSTIEKAAKVIGNTWPLYSFVTSNPLSGYENTHFRTAVGTAQHYLNAAVYPEADVFKQAQDNNEIDPIILSTRLKENGFLQTPEFYLKQMKSNRIEELNTNQKLDSIMSKWLAVFMDEGLAEWKMPEKDQGFYRSWRKLAKYDIHIPIKNNSEIPETCDDALKEAIEDIEQAQYEELFTQHLAALPGWTGYINHRTSYDSHWQQQHPISIKEYLAVRLWTAKKIGIPLLNTKKTKTAADNELLPYIWLTAWEQTWQNYMVYAIKENNKVQPTETSPDAQFVFCIDTRSELIRRHVEAQGNYETYGYAGFFGIAMDYKSIEDDITRKSCPPIVNSAYQVTETAAEGKDKKLVAYYQKNERSKFKEAILKRMKNMLPSTFGFVEGSGLFYLFSLLSRTIMPAPLLRFKESQQDSFEDFTTPQINCTSAVKEKQDIPLDEKVAIVKSGFDLMGWKKFAPIVVFAGHGGQSANNPFASSLDCGACAASPGRHNARMLAHLANLKEVRQVLQSKHQLIIPDDTVFIGAEHNTTTDDIKLFEDAVPAAHLDKLIAIKEDLKKAQTTATKERLGVSDSSIAANRKSNDWSETRPEWGLAKNAGFIVAPRDLTKNISLNSRCFLHSYDCQQDPEGAALEGIMQGPMVVTQWINNHYYFSTVDNNTFGGGSKITHNITGKFGVVQGNGGDLKMGLPLQSVKATDIEMYHQPLRLSVLINAPITTVTAILSRNPHLQSLLDNEWIYLMVMDPKDGGKVKTYRQSMQWL